MAVLLALVLALLGLAIWSVLASRSSKAQRPASEAPGTARVGRRDFVRALRLNGTVEAVRSRAITAPQIAGGRFEAMIITKLVRSGTAVKQGDLLAEFDRQGQIRNFLDKQAEYRDLEDQIAKKQADEVAARAKDETELKQAENALEKAKLEMLKNELIPRIDAEKNQETLEEAQANLKALRTTFDLKRRAARAEIHGLEIQRDLARQTMLYARRNEERMTVHAPMDGVVVLNNHWRGGAMGEVQEGDQIYSGFSFMQVVNPSAMEVRVKANQADLLDLQLGLRAQVRLDAYPEMVFPATLEELAPIGDPGQFSDKVRTFAAIFTIQGSDPKLMPDLSAAVDVELERQASVLVVPRESVITDNGQAYVRAKNGLAFEKHPVKLGPKNDFQAVVESGLRAGDIVERNLDGKIAD